MRNHWLLVGLFATFAAACGDDSATSGSGGGAGTGTGQVSASTGAGDSTSTGSSSPQGAGGGTGGQGAQGTGAGPGSGGAEVTFTVDAGDDVTIALPLRAVDLQGSATVSDGSTPTLLWERVDGTDATMAGELTGTLSLTGLVPGAYTFRLTATADSGDTASDEVNVTVTSTGQTFYVDAENGDDGTVEDPVDGSAATPWRTLFHACQTVPGDADHVIHIRAGDYVETAPCLLRPRVSIEGEGDDTHVIPADTPESNGYAAGIKLESIPGGVDGSQTISDFWLDGADVAHRGIVVLGRGNVLVRHMTFTDLISSGVGLLPVSTSGGAPHVYGFGNEISSSLFTDCSDRGATSQGGGVITMGMQDGAIIRDNVFHQDGRPTGQNGNVMKAVAGHNRGWKYYRNVSFKPVDDGPQQGSGGRGWNFALEVWNNEGGTEIWGNTFHGGGNAIDIGGQEDLKGEYDYSWFIHDNVFELDAQLAETPTQWIVPMGVQFEVPASDAEVSFNRFVRLAHGVQIILSSDDDGFSVRRIAIHHNVFEEMGIADSSLGGTMINVGLAADAVIGDIDIDHNTMLSGESGHARAALMLTNVADGGQLGPFHFRNNIVAHTRTWGYITFSGDEPIVDVTSSNNIVHDCLNEPPYEDNGAVFHDSGQGSPDVTNFTEEGKLTVDPELGADLHPLPGSPALGAAIDIGYGTTIGAFPE